MTAAMRSARCRPSAGERVTTDACRSQSTQWPPRRDVRRIPRPGRSVRRRLCSASTRAKPTRWTRNSGCCWKWCGRRSSTPGSRSTAWQAARTGVFLGVSGNEYAHLQAFCGHRATHLSCDRQLVGRDRQSRVIPVRLPRSQLGCRHGLFVVVGGRASSVRQPAARRMRCGRGWRRESDRVAVT